jgi:hypothetical protein
MKDWKWASVSGCPERMMAAKSHSISSVGEIGQRAAHFGIWDGRANLRRDMSR